MTRMLDIPGSEESASLRLAASKTDRPRKEPLPTVNFGALKVHAISESQCIAHVMAELAAGRGGFVATPNLDHLRRLGRDEAFARMYEHPDVIVADGMPLVWASRVQGTPLPERVAGSSLVVTLSEAAAENGRSLFLLGGAPETARIAAARLMVRFPGLRVAGTHCPKVGFEKDLQAMDEIAEALQSARPDIVYVGLGSPKQENLIIRLRPLLPHTWWLGVGASFNFLSGRIRRAPRWMQASGLEWLHRLSKEPGHLARRYLVEDLPFGVRLLGNAIGTRIKRKRAKATSHLAANESNR